MDRSKRCACRMEEIARYRNRLSGPLLDRIDIHLELPILGFGELSTEVKGESSAQIRDRVESARKVQLARFQGLPGVFCNAHMTAHQIETFCKLQASPQNLLRAAVDHLRLSARAYDRILKVGRTIADFAKNPDIREEHLAEAIHYRSLDRQLDPFA